MNEPEWLNCEAGAMHHPWCRCAMQVAFGVCAILAADRGEAYGIVWTPNSVPDAQQLRLTAGPRKNCYWYQVRSAAVRVV